MRRLLFKRVKQCDIDDLDMEPFEGYLVAPRAREFKDTILVTIRNSHGLQIIARFKCFIRDGPIDQSRPIIRYSHMTIFIWRKAHPAIHIATRLLHISSKIHKFILMMPYLSREVSPNPYFSSKALVRHKSDYLGS